MSCLKWHEAFPTQVGKHEVGLHYELWAAGQDRTAWYNLPVAYIYRINKRKYELVFEVGQEKHYYTTLKAAKAMGIALVRMDDAV